MHPPKRLLLTALAFASTLFPLTALGQAIIGTVSGSNQAVVFPSPDSGLPTPARIPVPGLPSGAAPHGVAYYGSDNALVSDFGNSRVFVIQISTATLVDTILTSPSYNGTGTIAVVPGLNLALAAGGTSTLSVIAFPFGAGVTINTVELPGTVATYQTQAVVFNPAGRAFVYHTTGISVLDPPYSSIAFTIPVTNPVSGAIAISPDGNQLLVTDLMSGTVRIFNAPFSATSLPDPITIMFANSLDGIAASPDGTVALVVNLGSNGLWAISAPFSSSSTVEILPLPSVFGGHEDVGISADGQLAILAGNGGPAAATAFVQAPFTAADATIFNVSIPGGRGNGAVRFLPPGLAPGLTISKTAPATILSGANLSYLITYGNTGGADVNGVIIRDPIPAGTSFVSATGGGTFSAGVVTWNIGTIPAENSGLTVSFTVNVTATSGTVDNFNYTIEGVGVSPIPGPPVSTIIAAGPTPTTTGNGPTSTPTRNTRTPTLGPGPAADVPTLAWPMLAVLAGLIAFVAVSLLARRR